MLQGVKIRNDEAKARMLLFLSLSIMISLFVTYDRHNQLLKAEREREREGGRFEYVYTRQIKVRGVTISNTVMILRQRTRVA